MNNAPKQRRRVGSYPDALDWLALNDDNEWLCGEGDAAGVEHMSVAACLVRDVFGRTEEELVRDLRREIAKNEGVLVVTFPE